MDSPPPRSRYTDDEKSQLIKNLDLEVSHRVVQLRRELDDRLETFKMNHEMRMSLIPKPVRNMTMREFGEQYGGNIQAAFMGFQKAKFVRERGQDALERIDKDTRKRKWVASQESDLDGPAMIIDGPRGSKIARTGGSPAKAGSSTGPGTAQRAHTLQKTPSKGRLVASKLLPSPSKSKPLFGLGRPPSRPTSPLKSTRPPSLSAFNPLLPSKAPAYPTSRNVSQNSTTSAESDTRSHPPRTLIRKASNISIRRDPSFALALNGLHTRSHSHTSLMSSSSLLPSSASHSRDNSDTTSDQLPSFQPNSQDTEMHRARSHTPLPSMMRSYSVTISTTDGHLLEFDPIQTSPRALDALEGITDSAKKQAREDMSRLVQAAVEKWKVA